MTLRVAFTFLLIMLAQACGAQMHETGTNFDLESVRPFLTQLNEKHRLGLDVDSMVSFTAHTAVDEERQLSVGVSVGGREISLRYSVYMGDTDAPDVSFQSADAAVIALIDTELEIFSAQEE